MVINASSTRNSNFLFLIIIKWRLQTSWLESWVSIHGWFCFTLLSYSPNQPQKLTWAKFPRPRNHLVILMFLSAFMTRAKMTISVRSHGKRWLSGSGSWRLTQVWRPGRSLHPRPPGQLGWNSGTWHLDQGHNEWNIWGSTKWLFYMIFSPWIYLASSIIKQEKKKKSQITRKTWRQGELIFECLDFSPGTFNTHEWSPSNNATGAILLENKTSWKLFPHCGKTKYVRIKLTGLNINQITNIFLPTCGTFAYSYWLLLNIPSSKLWKPYSLISTLSLFAPK